MNSNVSDRAFDSSFEAHKGLIHKFARKAYGRLVQAGVTIDYEDIFQEMSVTYVKAANKYDPTVGTSFSAYLGRAIWNDFNKFAEIETDHSNNIGSVGDFEDDEENMSFYEIVDSGVASPEQYAEIKQDIRVSARRLSRNANILVSQLLNPSKGFIEFFQQNYSKGNVQNITLRSIAKYHKMTMTEYKMAKRNLNEIYDTKL
jgi:RNA polymerase sigma factor (sigma-70 family)